VAFAAGSAGRSDSLAESEDMRKSLLHTTFPYIHFDQNRPRHETFDDLFDELDEIIAAKNSEGNADGTSGTPDDVGRNSELV
jgi:hypothetical protein